MPLAHDCLCQIVKYSDNVLTVSLLLEPFQQQFLRRAHRAVNLEMTDDLSSVVTPHVTYFHFFVPRHFHVFGSALVRFYIPAVAFQC